MSSEVIYKELVAFHPGSYIEEIVDELNITQAEFAERLGTSSKTVSKLINGEERISKDIANKLAKLTGISIETWLNLQVSYDIKMLEIEESQIEDERLVCDLIDFSYFKKHNFIKNKRYTAKEKISELRKLLNISSLSMLFEFNTAVSYRNTQEFSDKSIVNSNIMLELAINTARNVTNNKYNKKKLEKILPRIRKMTLEEPENFFPELEKLLLECGIVLVALPKLTNANLNGATKKFKNGSVLLLITDRNKSSDIFWFSLIHEIGHIYNNDFYSDYEDIDLYNQKEHEADCFAQEFFISSDLYSEFVSKELFNESTILEFAKTLEIHPSILVGRLQNDKYVDYHEFNNLKSSYNVSITHE